MTDNTTPAVQPVDDSQPKAEPGLLLRRAIVWIVALIMAIVVGALILQVIVPAIWPNNGRIPLDALIPISFVNIPLLPIMAIPLTILFMIWLDFIFRTRIVND